MKILEMDKFLSEYRTADQVILERYGRDIENAGHGFDITVTLRARSPDGYGGIRERYVHGRTSLIGRHDDTARFAESNAVAAEDAMAMKLSGALRSRGVLVFESVTWNMKRYA